jgi:HTH-type transcriptional regulator/antitoxin HipB
MKVVNGLKIYSHQEMLDRVIGKKGTPVREKFEFNLQMEVIGDMIKKARKNKNLTQEQLGKLVGVQKAQISKLEKSVKNVTIDTIIKVFDALDTKVKLSFDMPSKKIVLHK